MSVLIVDDNEHNREYARQVLAEFWPVTLAEGGAEALSALRGELPRLVLLDLSMPEVDGWAVLEQVRAERAWEGLPVVACSAHAMSGDKERALASGFDAYLTKPYRPHELIDMVSRYLGPPGGEGEDGDDGWGDDDWELSEDEWKEGGA